MMAVYQKNIDDPNQALYKKRNEELQAQHQRTKTRMQELMKVDEGKLEVSKAVLQKWIKLAESISDCDKAVVQGAKDEMIVKEKEEKEGNEVKEKEEKEGEEFVDDCGTEMDDRANEINEALKKEEKKLEEKSFKKPQLVRRQSSIFSSALEAKRIELHSAVNKYCSKIGNMVVHLKQILQKPETRVIIFSQFSSFLVLLSTILGDEGIANTTVEGNIQRKQKALKEFKNEDSASRVIMLSLSKSASGTNLMEATHVILLDPMTCSKEEAFALEQQAIGRAYRQGQTRQVTIVRFVIRNTIEEVFHYRNNTKEDEEDQNEVKLIENVDATSPEKPVTTSAKKRQLLKSTSFGTFLATDGETLRKDSFLELINDEEELLSGPPTPAKK
jgi:SNF2 family DNA or RNA helicase